MFIGIRKAKGTEETIVVGDGEHSGMEEEFVVCEHIKEIEKRAASFASQSAAAKKKSSDSCGICETQDHVLEERDETKKRWRS